MSAVSCYVESYNAVILIDCILCNYISLKSRSYVTVNKVVIILCCCCFAVLVSIFVDAVGYCENEFSFAIACCEVSDCIVECFCSCVNFCLTCFSLTENFLSVFKSFFVSGILISIKVTGVVACIFCVGNCFTKSCLVVRGEPDV